MRPVLKFLNCTEYWFRQIYNRIGYVLYSALFGVSTLYYSEWSIYITYFILNEVITLFHNLFPTAGSIYLISLCKKYLPYFKMQGVSPLYILHGVSSLFILQEVSTLFILQGVPTLFILQGAPTFYHTEWSIYLTSYCNEYLPYFKMKAVSTSLHLIQYLQRYLPNFLLQGVFTSLIIKGVVSNLFFTARCIYLISLC